jgi:tetratricopeptide (TPR) repeat protein
VQHGSTLLSLGRFEAARGSYQHAVELSRSIGDELLEQRAYGGLGVTYSQMNMPVEALNHLMLALDLARANNDAAHEAQWLASIGEALWKFDQQDDAIKAIQQAIAAARTADDPDLQAGMLSLLGQIHVSNREPGKARQYYGHALDLYRELGESEEEIQTLSALGALAMDADQPAEAIRLYDEALQLAAQTDQRAPAVRIYGRLARLSQRQGDNDAAIEALEQAANLAGTMPDQRALYGQALQHLAVAQDVAGLPVAMDTYEEALDIAREVGDTYGESMMLVNVGARLISLGALDDGATILEHAIRLTEDLGQMGMKVRQRAESLLVPVRTQARAESGRRVPPTRERSVSSQREARSLPYRESTGSIPPASAIPVAPNEMYSQAVSFNR